MAWTRKSSLPHCFSTSAKTASRLAGVGHVAMAGDMRAEFGGQRLDALLEGVALIGQRDLGALVGAGLGDAPGDRPIVGDAEDQAALAGHQALSTRHMRRSPIARDTARAAYRTGQWRLQALLEPDARGEADVADQRSPRLRINASSSASPPSGSMTRTWA